MNLGPGWPKKDRIRWVEMRLTERRAEEKEIQFDLDKKGIPDARSLEAWLAKERDGRSWAEVAQKHYLTQYRKSKSAAISKVRRDYLLVENSPNSWNSFRYDMDLKIRDLFGCSPQDFKRYLDSLRGRNG